MGLVFSRLWFYLCDLFIHASNTSLSCVNSQCIFRMRSTLIIGLLSMVLVQSVYGANSGDQLMLREDCCETTCHDMPGCSQIIFAKPVFFLALAPTNAPLSMSITTSHLPCRTTI
jgi:hypothetical protein